MDRKFSDGTVWDNSIDYDDAPDGSEGGYTKHGSYICAPAMTEIIELRKKSESQQARIEALEEALTPSAETKAAYWGEAGLTNDWTLIKAVMKAIRERALQEPAK